MRGFSLIELSIVIIIISILIIGSLVSSQFIFNYKLKKVYYELSNYHKAIKIFQEIYHNIPGDMNNGYQFFPKENYCDNGLVAINYKGCNGNADNIITGIGQTKKNDVNSLESILFFYHLYQAKLMSFDNKNNANLFSEKCPNYINYEANNNIPSFYVNSSWSAYLQGLSNKEISFTIAYSNNVCKIDDLEENILTASQISIIDKKYDDGKAKTGNIINNNCINDKGKYLVSDLENCNFKYRFLVY